KALIDMAKESLIKTDKSEHKGRSNPPAWKALEFMSFGTIIKLYENLKNPKLLCEISNVYGMSHPSQFSNYINVVRKLRNYCAHGKVLFDLNLDEAISDGPLGYLGNQKNSLFGIYSVFKYFLGRISSNRVKEMQAELLRAFDRVPYPSVKTIIFNNSGFNIEDI
ncbi:Abi family protein, partial [Bacteroides xylanisolvens]